MSDKHIELTRETAFFSRKRAVTRWKQLKRESLSGSPFSSYFGAIKTKRFPADFISGETTSKVLPVVTAKETSELLESKYNSFLNRVENGSWEEQDIEELKMALREMEK